MSRHLKRPNGILIEEGAASTVHLLENGEITEHDSDFDDYTGRFCFQHKGGKRTRWYTEKTAPLWLRTLYEEAIHQR